MGWWRRSRVRGPAPRVVTGPCPECGHETTLHPWPGQQNLTRCAECVWEEDHDEREPEDMCARRFARLDQA